VLKTNLLHGLFKRKYLMYIYYSMEQITLISLCVPNLDTITIILNKFENYANITY